MEHRYILLIFSIHKNRATIISCVISPTLREPLTVYSSPIMPRRLLVIPVEITPSFFSRTSSSDQYHALLVSVSVAICKPPLAYTSIGSVIEDELPTTVPRTTYRAFSTNPAGAGACGRLSNQSGSGGAGGRDPPVKNPRPDSDTGWSSGR